MKLGSGGVHPDTSDASSETVAIFLGIGLSSKFSSASNQVARRLGFRGTPQGTAAGTVQSIEIRSSHLESIIQSGLLVLSAIGTAIGKNHST